MASPAEDRKRSFDDTSESTGPKIVGSPKSKTPDAHEHEESGKKKRRKVNHACVYCRRSHMTCDLQRPCARCVKRDIGHLCHDEPREPPKRGKSDVGVAEMLPTPDSEVKAVLHGSNGNGQYGSNGNGDMRFGSMDNVQQIAQPQPISPNQMQRPQSMDVNSNSSLLNFDWNSGGVQNQFQDMHHLHPNYMFNTSEVTNEYNLLNDFLSTSLLDDGALYSNNDDAQALYTDPLLATSSINLPLGSLNHPSNNVQIPPIAPPPPQVAAGNEISRPSSTYPVDTRARDKFYMTAADPAGLSSAEDRLHKLLKAKYDAGMLKPFNYVKGYAKLNTYMEKNMSRESRVRILRQLDRFRPKFREAMHSLTDMQLVLVEMWFERSLMEYDRVFASMAIPACCWRRTGEIFRGNKEMADLIDVPIDRLRDGKLAIHEIIAEESLVSYWEKFGAIAFDPSQKAILTSCVLKSPGSEGKGKRCCFSFTIRRDTHSIPSLVVGNWIPIAPK
ncbi:Transcription factor [Oleoguttula sp. CCFEE 5521]